MCLKENLKHLAVIRFQTHTRYARVSCSLCQSKIELTEEILLAPLVWNIVEFK